MQGFVAALLSEAGALVEPIEPEGLEVLAPPSLRQPLGIGEFSRFGFSATLPEGAERIGIESDWLGRFDRILGQRGRWNRQVLRPVIRKLPDAEALLERELLLDNATFRLRQAESGWTRYLVFDFRVTALSEEKREGMVRLALNLATGAIADVMIEPLRTWSAEGQADLADDAAAPAACALPQDWQHAQLLDRIRQALPCRAESMLASFTSGLRRRLARDLDRLHAYHNDLHREAGQRGALAGAEEAVRAREALRRSAIEREYRAKLDDLAHKYALRVSAEWVQTQELVVPVHRLTVQLRRRKAERMVALDWNTLARRLEPPTCEACWSTDRPRLVCDDALHLVSAPGLASCEGCGRPYCRACRPQACPKCGRAGRLGGFATDPQVSRVSGDDVP